MVQTLSPQPVAGLYVYDAEQPLTFPLKHTQVNARISGNISRVDVTQTFENPLTTALDVTYVFPLPDEAAVDTMVIRLGDRTIQGRIEKRETAQTLYEQAKQQGKTAALLEQERANIFTQSLANILPGEQIEVMISYSDRLGYTQGDYEFIFPMVVGPRYIPGNPLEASDKADASDSSQGSADAPMLLNQDTDIVPDASRLNGPFLPTGIRSGHDIQVTVEIETGAKIANLRSPSHQILIDTQSKRTRITLTPSDTLPNKDLILRYQVADDVTQTSLLTQTDPRGGHFAVYLIPALSYDITAYIPKEMVFLIDTSGSQSGSPLAQCQTLMRQFIEGLHPQDTFNIVNFANTTQQLAKVSLENTPGNRQQALNYIDRLRAGGGTEMMRGFRTVLNLPQLDSERIRNIVLLTDGYIGNEAQIFAEVQRSLGPSARLHSFGAGSSVNRFLLNRVAELGRGMSHIVRHDEAVNALVETFLNQINNPVLGNLSVRWEGPGEAPSIYPTAIHDLFADQPLVLSGRKGDHQPGRLQITGMTAGGTVFEKTVSVDFDPSGNPAVAQLWGRARIKDLMNQMASGETVSGVEAVTETALAYQLLSQYTAFIAIGDDVRVEPSHRSTATMPVLMPEAVSYDGIFGTAAAPVRARMPQPAARPTMLKRRAMPQSAARRLDSPMSADAIAPMPAAAPPPSIDLSAAVTDDQIMSFSEAATTVQQIQLIKADGLQTESLEQLQHQLHQLQLTNPQEGNLFFELVVQRGRVKRIMLDTVTSDPQNSAVVDQIRQALLSWRCPQPQVTSLRIELRVQSTLHEG